jgi:hypothetical protein
MLGLRFSTAGRHCRNAIRLSLFLQKVGLALAKQLPPSSAKSSSSPGAAISEQCVTGGVTHAKGPTFRGENPMKHLLITSMIALGVGCGAAMAQTESAQPSGGDNNCAAGTADCQKGGKAGGQAQGEMKSQTQQNAQGKAGANTEEQAQGKAKMKTDEQAQGQAGTSTDQNAQDNTQLKKKQQAQGKTGTTEQNAQGNTKMQTEQNAQGKTGTTTQQNAQDKTKTQTDQQAQGKTGTTTEQNAQGGTTKLQTQQNAQGKTGTTTDQNAQGTTKMQTEQNAQGNTNVETDQNKTASINNVTVEQKTQITQVIHETHVEPVRDVSFEISVGVEVPRHKVRLHRLPARIVKIVPAYESYEYFVLADGRIVIVDPDTYKIVVILS